MSRGRLDARARVDASTGAPRVSRRAAIAGAAAALAWLAAARPSGAMGRTPLGGRVTLHVPWPTDAIDPHDLRDPAAALFGSAIADPVYALDASGSPYPALAEALPVVDGGRTVVRLRDGLLTARGVPLAGADLVASIERARARGASAVLAGLPAPRRHPHDRLAAVFGAAPPQALARALASPLVALLPRAFLPGSPDGTGAFAATTSPGRLLLQRNARAARGAAFLDAVEVRSSTDLRESLRAFEAERDDVGWLGAGLHQEREGALRFDLGRAGWAVLSLGAAAGAFGMPGVAQQLADGLPAERIAHLGLSAAPSGRGDAAWGGPSAELFVDEASPHLVEIAETIAPALSRPGHELRATPVTRSEIAERRASGKLVAAIDFVRASGPDPIDALLALATVDDPSRARDVALHPPKLSPSAGVATLTRSLRLGVLGEIRIAGAAVRDVVLAGAAREGWDLGASYRKARRTP